MKITVVGAGYVGLVSSGCFADFGHEVTLVESDPAKLKLLERGRMPIYEPGLEALIARNVDARRLRFTADLAGAAAQSNVVFIAVGTPACGGMGATDLSYVYGAAEEIAGALQHFTVIATKSTVPVGTGDELERIIARRNPLARFAVVSNPEFLREGSAIEDFKRPDRIIIGAENERAKAAMTQVYDSMRLGAVPVFYASRRSAELTKYAANAFLAMKVSFINEIADLCEVGGANVQEVARGIGMDRRIGRQFLDAGPGYGGSCLPKDTRALAHAGRQARVPLRLVEATIAANEERSAAMARKVVQACGGCVRGKKIAVLGLTFKPDTDDMRDAPSISIIRELQTAGGTISAYDPAGMAQAKQILANINFGRCIYDTANMADALVIITEWDEFRTIDFKHLKRIMHDPVIVDLRNIFRQDDTRRKGFRYTSVGEVLDDAKATGKASSSSLTLLDDINL